MFAEPSGDACDHYHRYPEDIATMAALGFNAYRFSLEWSRIEPEPGYFSRAALDHYRRMIATCHEHGITPVVTYCHFTTPRWFAGAGWLVEHGRARAVRPLRGAGHGAPRRPRAVDRHTERAQRDHHAAAHRCDPHGGRERGPDAGPARPRRRVSPATTPPATRWV